MPKTLEPILAEHPFCKDLAPHYLQLLVGCAANVVFRPDDVIVRLQEKVDRFYLIRSGRVAIEVSAPCRGEVCVQTLGEGNVLGWSWLIPPYQATFNARAVKLTRAIGIDGKCLRKKCETDHDLGYELYKRVAPILVRQLEATQLQLLDFYRTES